MGTFEIEVDIKIIQYVRIRKLIILQLLRSGLFTKQPNIFSNETIPSRKFLHLIPSTQLGLCSPDQCGKGWRILPALNAWYWNTTSNCSKVRYCGTV